MPCSFSSLRFSLYLAGVSVFLLALNPAFAADFPQRKVTTVGTATVKVVPDEMHWTVQISIDDSTLAKAKARHDGSLTDALKFIKSFGGGIKDLQTGGIRIQKNNYAPPDSSAAKTPFNCSTQLTFTLTDFDKYGALCDGLAKLDGVQVQSVDYAYSKQEDAQRDALKKALLNAHDKASDLAVTANCYIDKPLEILEGVP
ncbi:MAG TPA: SIMPL domain-containing protein, partial [Candidatus Methylacidiphilales bacterium]